MRESEATKTSETTSENKFPQSSALANQTTNQKVATMTETTKMAGNKKHAERPQSAFRNLKQKIKERQTKHNK